MTTKRKSSNETKTDSNPVESVNLLKSARALRSRGPVSSGDFSDQFDIPNKNKRTKFHRKVTVTKRQKIQSVQSNTEEMVDDEKSLKEINTSKQSFGNDKIEIDSNLVNEIVQTKQKLESILNQLPPNVCKPSPTDEQNTKKDCILTNQSMKECTVNCNANHSQMQTDIRNIAKMVYKLEKKNELLVKPTNSSFNQQPYPQNSTFQPVVPQEFVVSNDTATYNQSTLANNTTLDYFENMSLYPLNPSLIYSEPSMGLFGNIQSHPNWMNPLPYFHNNFSMQHIDPRALQIPIININQNFHSMFATPSMLHGIGSHIGPNNYF